MGVTITYSGKIKDQRLIPELINEFVDICDALKWKYTVLDESFDDKLDDQGLGLKGIIFTPIEQCEPIWLLFDKNLQLHSLVSKMYLDDDLPVFTKTQFAGVDIHIQIIKLLEYAQYKYMSDFNINDESGYAAHRSRAEALKVFQLIEDGLNIITEAIESINHKEFSKENSIAQFDIIEKRIKAFMKTKGAS